MGDCGRDTADLGRNQGVYVGVRLRQYEPGPASGFMPAKTQWFKLIPLNLFNTHEGREAGKLANEIRTSSNNDFWQMFAYEIEGNKMNKWHKN